MSEVILALLSLAMFVVVVAGVVRMEYRARRFDRQVLREVDRDISQIHHSGERIAAARRTGDNGHVTTH